MYETHKKGEIACCAVYRQALEKDILVSKPMIESRYDLILDDGKKLWRAQVRYCDFSPKSCENSFCIKLISECHNNGYRKQFSKDEVDVILVYLPSLDKILWLGPEMFEGRKFLSVRTQPAKNNQTKGVVMAESLYW